LYNDLTFSNRHQEKQKGNLAGNAPKHFWPVRPHRFTTVVFHSVGIPFGILDDIVKIGKIRQVHAVLLKRIANVV